MNVKIVYGFQNVPKVTYCSWIWLKVTFMASRSIESQFLLIHERQVSQTTKYFPTSFVYGLPITIEKKNRRIIYLNKGSNDFN